MRIIIFTTGLFGKTGICTWVQNFVANMHTEHEIVVLSATFSDYMQSELSKYAECVTYDKDITYECDIYLHNFQDNALKPNIHARHTFILLHCNYAKMRHSNTFDRGIKYIAVSEDSAEAMRKVYKIDCVAIEPFHVEHKPNKVLRLVSATRLTTEKGYLRMVKLAELLKANHVRFQWLVFSEYEKKIADIPEFINMGAMPNDVILDYMADADYLVQLSDHEGYGYSVHEALSVGTPCLVTDLPVFQNVIVNGYNGYRLPLDMQNINISEIVNNIPLGYEINGKSTDTLKDKWGRLINED